MCALKQHHPRSAPENDSPPNFVSDQAVDDTNKTTQNEVISKNISIVNAPIAPRKSRALLKRRMETRNTAAAKKKDDYKTV